MGRRKNEFKNLQPSTRSRAVNGRFSSRWLHPRELEGKMRSGRQKFERQTEALANDLCAEINAQTVWQKSWRASSPVRESGNCQKSSFGKFWNLAIPIGEFTWWISFITRKKPAFVLRMTTFPQSKRPPEPSFGKHMQNLENKKHGGNYRLRNCLSLAEIRTSQNIRDDGSAHPKMGLWY